MGQSLGKLLIIALLVMLDMIHLQDDGKVSNNFFAARMVADSWLLKTIEKKVKKKFEKIQKKILVEDTV